MAPTEAPSSPMARWQYPPIRARVYCSSVRSSNRRMRAIWRNRRSAWSRSSRTGVSVSAGLAIPCELYPLVRYPPCVATPVTVPSLGEETTSAILIRFLVEPGAEVHRGDPLFELDTDKVTQEVEAEADGVLLAVTGEPGGEYAPGATVAWIGQAGEAPPA